MREIVKDKGGWTLVFGFGIVRICQKSDKKLQEWVSCALEVWLVTK